MKYTTPSIEVVTFNPADAARIGMQWFYANNANPVSYVPAPVSYSGPTSNHGIIPASVNWHLTNEGVACNGVGVYWCDAETGLPSDAAVFTASFEGPVNFVVDDGKSC